MKNKPEINIEAYMVHVMALLTSAYDLNDGEAFELMREYWLAWESELTDA